MIVYLLYCRKSMKFYVGQTRCDLDTRWLWHVKGQCNIYLRRAIKKYGPDGFDREILAVASSQSELNRLEQLWIAVLKSANPKWGYNIRPGGTSVHSVATKRKIRDSKLGVPIPKSVRKQISRGMKEYWKRRRKSTNRR